MSTLFWSFVGLILYTYAGYPLLVWIFSRWRRESPPCGAPLPSVTLLVAAHNEEAVIAQKIDNILALDFPRDRLQIVVAADGSTDGTVRVVQSYMDRGVVLSYSPKRRGKMAAINRAVDVARGDIIVFSDANNMYEPAALRELVEPFGDCRIGAVSGAKHILPGDGALGDSEGLYWKYESFIKSAESRLGSCTGVAGEILAVRRSLFEPAPETVICDDFHVAMRIARRGFRIAYAPRARSWERVSPSLNDERARRARIVAGRFQSMAMAPRLLSFRRPVLMWQLISHKFLRPLVPFAMLGALATNVALVVNPPSASATSMWILAPPFGAVLLLGQIAFYVLALLGGAAGGRGKRLKILFVPTFLVSSNAAAVVGLIRFARQHQHAAWTRVARRDGVAGSVPGADT